MRAVAPQTRRHKAPRPDREGWRRAGMVSLVVSGILVALVSGVMTWRQQPGGPALALGYTTLVGLGAARTLWKADWVNDRHRRVARWSGVAVGLTVLSQVLEFAGPRAWAASGVVGVVGLLILTLVVRPFVFVEALSGVRSTVEIVSVRLAVSAAAWRLGYVHTYEPAQAVPIMVMSGVILGAALTVLTRSLNTGLTLLACAAVALVLVDLVGRPFGGHPATQLVFELRWAATAVFWPLVWVGVVLVVRRRTGDLLSQQARVERRSQVTMASITTLCLGVVVLSALRDPVLDVTTWWFIAAVVLGLWVREVVRAVQSHRLTQLLRRRAQTDPLTGLGNRRALDARLRALSRRRQGQVGVLTVDLDRFKDANDILGHARVDDLLGAIGRRLAAGLPRAELFRVGGDEFVAVFPAAADLLEVAGGVNPLVAQASATVPGAERLDVTASVGVDHVDLTPQTTQEELAACVAPSGHAMRRAKTERTHVARYDESMARAHARRLLIEQRLREAMDGVQVMFQPIVSLGRGRLVGAEALARWTDAYAGVVTPDEFIEAAEDVGLIEALGQHVLRRSLDGAVRSGLIGGGHTLSVNVSALQLRQPGFVTMLFDELSAAAVPQSQVIVEVTESIFVQAEDAAVDTLVDLAGRGIRISLDDFGTGYSSLSYLTRLPVRGLKIDRSLTHRLGERRTDGITGSIVQLARQLGLDIVVEGVETVAQEDLTRALGVDLVQGWLYSPAVDVTDLQAMLARQNGTG